MHCEKNNFHSLFNVNDEYMIVMDMMKTMMMNAQYICTWEQRGVIFNRFSQTAVYGTTTTGLGEVRNTIMVKF